MADYSGGNWGLLNTMSNGIKEGLLAYQTTQNMNRQNQMMNLAYGIQQGENGLEYTPEKAEEIKNERLQKSMAAKSSMEDYDPNSESAKRLHQFGQQAGVSGLDPLSPHQIQQVTPIIDAKFKAQASQNSLGIRQQNFDYKKEEDARKTWNSQILNSGVNKNSTRLDGAVKIIDLINKAEKSFTDPNEKDPVKSTQPLLHQLNAEISRLETGSNSPAASEQEKGEMKSNAAELQRFLDSIKGTQTSSDLRAQFAQGKNMVKELAHSYTQQIDTQANNLKMASDPSQTSIYEQKHEQLKNSYRKRGLDWGDEPQTGQGFLPGNQPQNIGQPAGLINKVAPTPTPAQPQGNMVDVIAPDGSHGKIPKANLEAAIKRGAKLAGEQ